MSWMFPLEDLAEHQCLGMRTHIPTYLSMGQTAHLYTTADLQIPNAS